MRHCCPQTKSVLWMLAHAVRAVHLGQVQLIGVLAADGDQEDLVHLRYTRAAAAQREPSTSLQGLACVHRQTSEAHATRKHACRKQQRRTQLS